MPSSEISIGDSENEFVSSVVISLVSILRCLNLGFKGADLKKLIHKRSWKFELHLICSF